MTMADLPTPINFESLKKIAVDELDTNNNMTLETLAMLLNVARLKHLHKVTDAELTDVRKQQSQISTLHKLLKKVNGITDAAGGANFNKDGVPDADLQALISQARDIGAEVDPAKTVYTKEERDRFVENIRMTVEDLNVKNDMQLNTINRLTNERYESFQLLKTIFKPLHEANMQAARGAAGR